jgi:hypothetical protein
MRLSSLCTGLVVEEMTRRTTAVDSDEQHQYVSSVARLMGMLLGLAMKSHPVATLENFPLVSAMKRHHPFALDVLSGSSKTITVTENSFALVK